MFFLGEFWKSASSPCPVNGRCFEIASNFLMCLKHADVHHVRATPATRSMGFHAPWDTSPVHVLDLVRGRLKEKETIARVSMGHAYLPAFYSRVTLGRAHKAPGELRGQRRAPDGYHNVVAEPGIPGNGGRPQEHRKFISSLWRLGRGSVEHQGEVRQWRCSKHSRHSCRVPKP